MSNFNELFTGLQKMHQSEKNAFRLKHEKIQAVGDRLYDLFNDKSAQYIIPPLTKQGRVALDKVQRDLIDLSRQITISMIRKEYDAHELGVLLTEATRAVASPIGPHLNDNLDPRMAGVAGVLVHSLELAYQDAQKVEEPLHRQKRDEVCELEKEVFKQFLKEDPDAAPVMKRLASAHMFYGLSAEQLSTDLHALVTDGYMKSLKLQLDEILQVSSVMENMWVRKRNISEDEASEKLVNLYGLSGVCEAMTCAFFKNPEKQSQPKILGFGS